MAGGCFVSGLITALQPDKRLNNWSHLTPLAPIDHIIVNVDLFSWLYVLLSTSQWPPDFNCPLWSQLHLNCMAYHHISWKQESFVTVKMFVGHVMGTDVHIYQIITNIFKIKFHKGTKQYIKSISCYISPFRSMLYFSTQNRCCNDFSMSLFLVLVLCCNICKAPLLAKNSAFV